jgi:hypothetical protein
MRIGQYIDGQNDRKTCRIRPFSAFASTQTIGAPKRWV